MPLGISTGAVNQLVPVADTRMPKSVPLRLIAVTTEEPAMPLAGIGQCLAHRHADIEEELIVAANESEARGEVGAVPRRFRERRCKLAQQQAGAPTLRWCISSPMVRPRAISGFSGDAARFAQRARHGRAEYGLDPAQPAQHFGIVAAEPHYLAEAFVEAQ